MRGALRRCKLRSRGLGHAVVLLDAHGDVRLVGLSGALGVASYETVGQQGGALDVGDQRHAEVDRGTSDEVPGADLLCLLCPLLWAARPFLRKTVNNVLHSLPFL